jgi:alpha-galactosidase
MPPRDTRRSFLKTSATLGATLLTAARAVARVPDPSRAPDEVTIFTESDPGGLRLTRSNETWHAPGIEVETDPGSGKILLHAPQTAVIRIRLRWEGSLPTTWRYLGDQWERSYGDLEWRGLVGERLMPWYFLASASGATTGYGVKTGAAAICCWQADAGGITLWLDVSNGGRGVQLGDRRLHAATLVIRKAQPGETPAAAARALCRQMCEKPSLPAHPIYGSNNWYYAYGQNMSADASLKDAALMAELMPNRPENTPYVVIDMGWGRAPEGAGPVAETQPRFPDMAGLAAQMKQLGVRPGLWTRPTLTTEKRAMPWRLPPAGGRTKGDLITIDPSIPEALAYIGDNIRTIHAWGFEIIKHDFSTFDLTGRWGFQMGPDVTDRGWHFNDRTKTTAEIVVDLYRTIRTAAGDAALIGCNTIGHLAAGLVEAQRIGDDTSGREWSRTRKMGVNALAFRIAQHNTFFAADADCVPVTSAIAWNLTTQWLDLVARSGTALFVSVDPAVIQPEQKPALQAAFAAAARVQEPGTAIDWMDTTIPETWRLDGKPVRYNWYLDE